MALQNKGVFHHILTTNPPMAQRTRRLAPGKYRAAQVDIKQLCDAPVCQSLNGSWATPTHLVDKSNGEWHVRAYRWSRTVRSHHPIFQLKVSSANLHGKTVFSALNFHMAFHKISVALKDLLMTAVITPFERFKNHVKNLALEIPS